MSSPPLAILLFCSGLSALVYETLWVKQMTLVVGVDVYAVTTVVSAFFAGLAAGSAVLGARADRAGRPLRLFAGLEAGTALLGAGVTTVLGMLAPLYVRATGLAGAGAWVLPFLLVAAPAFLMGGTLPAVVRAAERPAAGVGTITGRLYAANTAGGVAGTLLTVSVLVPVLGVRGSGLAAAALNATVAAAAAALARPVEAPASAAPTSGAPRRSSLALLLYMVAGAAALGLEVVWTQAAVPLLGTRAVGFALVLATYLGGVMAGSAVYARLADRARRPWLAFGVLEIGVGASALAAFAALGPWLPGMQQALAAALLARTGAHGLALGAHMLLVPIVLLLVPALLLGAAFPAAARLACTAEHVGRDVGSVAALNTLGGIAGTCLTGFLGIPLLGLRGALGTLAAVAALVGGVALVRGAAAPRRAALVAMLAAVAVAGGAALVPRDHLATAFLAMHGGELASYEESPGGTVTVVAEPFFDTSFRRLYIDGVSNSNDGLMSRRYMRLQALLPLVIHDGTSRSALVVGLGTGTTCGALLAFPGLERRACVELLPAVVRAVHHFAGNYDVASDPRVEIRVADGRHDLLLRDERYDLITLEPPPPIAAGVVNLYSRDFYQLCRRRLAPGGLMAQWLPLSTQNDEETRALARTFLDVFPAVTLWSTEIHEMLLVGSAEAPVLDAGRIADRMRDEGVAAALAEVGVPDVASLLATYVTDRAGVEAYAGDAPAVTDDRPRIEHASLARPGEFARALAHVLASRREPPLVGASDTLLADMRVRRERLLDFYQAAVYWYAGQQADVEPLLERVLSDEPTNPYYLWFVGGDRP